MTKIKTFCWILLFLSSCAPEVAKKNSKPLVTGSWLKRQNALRQKERAPAALPPRDQITCFDDRFSTPNVKQEALQEEARLSGEEKIQGSWKHLELETLPLPQAKFLKAIGDKLGDLNHPDALSYRHCKDAICVVNAIYQSRDELEGWVTYLWYLKTGVLLTFKNEVYKQIDLRPGVYNKKNYELKDYLFSRDELQVFWHVAHEARSKLQHVETLKEIQRLPRGSLIEKDDSTICGRAHSSGYIVLGDRCLDISPQDKNESFMYVTLTHEMAHHLDWKLGKNSGTQDPWYSHQAPWMKEASWTMKEYWDEKAKKMVQTWTSSLQDDQFVRSYAKQNPSEHFADTLAHFRYRGPLTKEKIPPNLYEYFRHRIFNESEFSSTGQIDWLTKDLLPQLVPDFVKLAAACKGDEHQEVGACLKNGLDKLSQRSVADLMYNHPDGCHILNKNEQRAQFRARIVDFFSAQFKEDKILASATPQELKDLAQYNAELEESSIPIKAVTDCRKAKDEKACYEERLRLFTAEKLPADAPAQSDNLYAFLAKNYRETHSFQEAQVNEEELYRSFIFSQSNLIHSKAQALWENCQAIHPSDAEAPIAGAFNVGEKWMVSSLFNCINSELPGQVKQLITEMTFESMAVADEKEMALLYEMSLPQVVKDITTLYEQATLEESERIATLEKKLRPLHLKRLTSSFAWAKRLGSTQILKSCGAEMLRDLPRDLRYHNPDEAFAPYVSNVCTEVLNSKAYKTWMKGQKPLARPRK